MTDRNFSTSDTRHTLHSPTSPWNPHRTPAVPIAANNGKGVVY